MPVFRVVAIGSEGKEFAGTVTSSDVTSVHSALVAEGYFPKEITKETAAMRNERQARETVSKVSKQFRFSLMRRRKVKRKNFIEFTRQLANLIDAGVPLLRSLTILAEQETCSVLRSAIETCCWEIRGGETFSGALAHYPKIFDTLFIGMVKAGELGGVLEKTLERHADFLEKEAKLKSKVLGAMMYPAVVSCVAIIILTGLLIFIVPKFTAIFTDILNGQALPFLTQMIITASDLVKDNAIYAVAVLILIFFGCKQLVRIPAVRNFLDAMILKLPLFGDLTRKNAIARFARTFGTLSAGGVPILEALRNTRDGAGNAVVADAIQIFMDGIRRGDTIKESLAQSRFFPKTVVNMIGVSEETGNLPDMLLQVADNYDEEVNRVVNNLTGLMEPFMIVFLALMIGTIVIALFLPLVGIISGMQQAQD